MFFIVFSYLFFFTTVLSAPTVAPRQSYLASVTGPGLAWYDGCQSHGTKGLSTATSYTCYSGPASKFPKITQWMNFKDMFALQKEGNFKVNGNTADQTNMIYQSILAVAETSKVDPRVILAQMIQESSGAVSVPCTNNGVENCGLMQSHAGVGFDPKNAAASIKQMIIDGVMGTASGDGMAQPINSNGNLYQALRIYNSGKFDPNNLSAGNGATPSYVSDMANRLMGWVGSGETSQTKACNFGT